MRHHLGLQGASVLATRHLLLTRLAVADLVETEAMGAIVGPAGLGKTFAIRHTVQERSEPVITLTFEARPTMRLVADRLMHALTGAPGSGTRFAMTDQLLSSLSERARLLIIGEAQNLNRDCFEYLRHLHDDADTRFALMFDGGDGCWEILSREPMLRSRIYRRVAFAPLTDSDVLTLIPTYHPIFAAHRLRTARLDQRQVRQRPATKLGCVHGDRSGDLSRRRTRPNRSNHRTHCHDAARHRSVSGAFEVLWDPDDDVRNVRAIHDLTRREPGVLVVGVPPDSDTPTAVRWAILRALGKRSEHLRGVPKWHHVNRWLTAHAITELVLLRAQHLTWSVLNEISEEVVVRRRIRVVLAYGGADFHAPRPTTELAAFMTRTRPPLQSESRERIWPTVPRVHPLRLRFDARATLSETAFHEVQQLLMVSLEVMSTWLLHNAGAALNRCAAAFEVVSTGLDEEHAFVRRSGASLALLTAGIELPHRGSGGRTSAPRRAANADTLLELLDPSIAGYMLARQVTGLPDELVDLIGGDQISDRAILGRRVPAAVRPILQALNSGYQPVLSRSPIPESPPPRMSDANPTVEPPVAIESTRILRWLLESKQHGVRSDDVGHDTRLELDELCAQNLAVNYNGAYRASDLALYGVFRRKAPAA